MRSAWLFAGVVCMVLAAGPVRAQTQMDMNQAAYERYQEADGDMNEVLRTIRDRFMEDAEFLKALDSAQKAWLDYRDAEVGAFFPLEEDENPRFRYGSVYPMCVNQLLERLTRLRIVTLRLWLDGEEEGNMCAGSLPLAPEPEEATEVTP